MMFDYDEFLRTAHERLETLYEQKTAIEKEIDALQGAIRGFAPLAKEPRRWLDPDLGITEAVASVLKFDPNRVFTAPEIRDELLRRGVPLEQKNPLATIHQVLSRLGRRGMVGTLSDAEGAGNRYKWAEGWEAEKSLRGSEMGVRIAESNLGRARRIAQRKK